MQNLLVGNETDYIILYSKDITHYYAMHVEFGIRNCTCELRKGPRWVTGEHIVVTFMHDFDLQVHLLFWHMYDEF